MHMSRQLTLSTVLIAVLASGIVLYQQISPTQASQTAKDPETDTWQMLVTQQIMASEYQFRKGTENPFEAFNRRSDSRFYLTESGFKAVKRSDADVRLEVTLDQVVADNLPLASTGINWQTESAELLVMDAGTYQIEYMNAPEGFRQNFIIEDPGEPAARVAVKLHMSGSGESRMTNNSYELVAGGQTLFSYGNLRAYDAYGRSLESHMELNGQELALVTDTRNAVFPVTIDPLTTTPDWSYEGNQVGANMAFAVSTAGDVNNDGYDDVVVGAAAYDAGETDEGKAFLFLGGPSGLSTTPVWEDEGDNESGLMGKSVAAAGDVNGDGYDDLLIGLGLYSGGESEEGRAHLYYGTSTGVTTEPVWWFEPNQAGVGLGFPLEGLGDVNNDGYDDVIIGGNGWDGDQVDEGRAYVFYGSADGLADEPDWTVDGNNTDAALGHAVSAAGDVNGDGYDDAIIGGWNYSGAIANCGKAWVFLGGPTGLADSPVWELEGDQSNGYFAFWVSGVGDVDNDGFDDIMIGAKRYDAEFVDEGKAWLFMGSPAGPETTASWTAEGDNDGAEYAIQFGPAGDVNNDGYADVIMGSHFHTEDFNKEGKAYLYLGGPSGLSATAAWTYLGGVNQANFGWTCDGAGDVNHDGFDDVIIGAFKYSNPETYEGSAFVFHGLNSCPTPSSYAVGSLAPTTADVSWTGADDATIYKVTVKGAGESHLYLSLNDSYTLTGLTPSKKYKSWVQTKCGTTWTLRSNVITFTTPPMRTSGEDQGEVYPNPTTGWLHITNSSSDAGNYQVRLFDLNGKMVMEMETGWLEAGIPASVDISHLSAGTYTWQTSCQGKTRQGLITKQ